MPRAFPISAFPPQVGWNREREPITTVRSGAVLTLELIDASHGQIGPDDDETIVGRIDLGQMNPLSGPIFIQDHIAGSAVQVDVLSVVPAPHGWTAVFPRFGLLSDEFPNAALLHWQIFNDRIESSAAGLRLTPAPFLGVMGAVPAAPGTHSVGPPRAVGGNLDTRQLGPGASLFLPTEVDGGMLGFGDAHARQGDGEVCGSAIEVSATATVRLTSRPDLQITMPEYVPAPETVRAEAYATTGIGPDLHEAARDAIRRMIEHLGREYRMVPEVAYMVCSAVVDLRISEIVDRPNWVVSAFWPADVVVS